MVIKAFFYGKEKRKIKLLTSIYFFFLALKILFCFFPDSVKIAFSENIKRENLNPIELGKMYQTYMEYLPQTETKNKKNVAKNITQLRDEVGKEFNVSIETIRTYTSLLDLPDELRSLVVLNHGDMKKGFSVTYGFELARIPSEQILFCFFPDTGGK